MDTGRHSNIDGTSINIPCISINHIMDYNNVKNDKLRKNNILMQ